MYVYYRRKTAKLLAYYDVYFRFHLKNNNIYVSSGSLCFDENKYVLEQLESTKCGK
jgi:hypothetical protein